MIAKLVGFVDGIADTYFVLMTSGGVGYQVFTTVNILSLLKIGQKVSFFIETNVREDHIHLYGFPSQEEKAWFNLLCTVQGVGSKVALSILSSMSTSHLFNSIVSGDKDFIATANGVGPKMALRIVSELKDKVEKAISSAKFISANEIQNDALYNVDLPVSDDNLNHSDDDKIVNHKSNATSKSNLNDLKIEAVSALVNLGYKKVEAFEAVARVASKFQNSSDEIDLPFLIKEALKEFNIF